MSKDFNNIEDIFKEAFEGFEANVDPSVWANIQQNISVGGNGVSPNNPTTVVAGSSKMALTKLVAGIAIAAGVVTSSYYLFVDANDSQVKEQVTESTKEVKNQETVVETEETNENTVNSVEDELAPQTKEVVSAKDETKVVESVTEKQATHTVATITNNNVTDEVVSNNTTQTTTSNVTIPSTQPKTTQKSIVEVADLNLKIKANTTKGKAPLDVEFNIEGEAAGYLWDFGDGTPSSSMENPYHTFTKPGNYNVKLTAIDKNANSKTVVQIITVENVVTSSLAPVPTVFSPNGDGLNDIIKVDGEHIVEFNAVVRDVKGNVVFEWDTIEGFWDGRDNGNRLMPAGTYYLVVVATGVDGEKHTVKQSVQLFK